VAAPAKRGVLRSQERDVLASPTELCCVTAIDPNGLAVFEGEPTPPSFHPFEYAESRALIIAHNSLESLPPGSIVRVVTTADPWDQVYASHLGPLAANLQRRRCFLQVYSDRFSDPDPITHATQKRACADLNNVTIWRRHHLLVHEGEFFLQKLSLQWSPSLFGNQPPSDLSADLRKILTVAQPGLGSYLLRVPADFAIDIPQSVVDTS
jgi:hypothetical protein